MIFDNDFFFLLSVKRINSSDKRTYRILKKLKVYPLELYDVLVQTYYETYFHYVNLSDMCGQTEALRD